MIKNTNKSVQRLPTLDDELPIRIEISSELADYLPDVFRRLKGACNKLAAQLNFQTMLANWYNDEENGLTINIHLLTPSAYQHHLTLSKEESTLMNEFTDDVFLQQSVNMPFTICIAITEKEQQLLNTHITLCKSLTEKKLVKVINLFADYLSLNKINN